MANAAPKEAPWETPRVEAEASGLRSTFCMIQPAKANAIPTMMPVTIRGIRMFQMIALVCAVPFPSNAVTISEIVRPDDPTEIETTTQVQRIATRTNNTSHLRRI